MISFSTSKLIPGGHYAFAMPGALPEGKVQGTFLGQSLFGHGFMINEPRDRASEFVSTEDALSPVLPR